jgi:hypothetical protein
MSVDITSAIAGVLDAQDAILAVMGVMLSFAFGVYGVSAVYELFAPMTDDEKLDAFFGPH